jgi:hypothetical protein
MENNTSFNANSSLENATPTKEMLSQSSRERLTSREEKEVPGKTEISKKEEEEEEDDKEK